MNILIAIIMMIIMTGCTYSVTIVYTWGPSCVVVEEKIPMMPMFPNEIPPFESKEAI